MGVVLVLLKGALPLAGDGLILGAFLADEVAGLHCCQSLRLVGNFIANLCHGSRWNYLGHLRDRGYSTKGSVMMVLQELLERAAVRLVIGSNTVLLLRIGPRQLIIVTSTVLAEVPRHTSSDVLAILPSLRLMESLLVVVMISVGQIHAIGAVQGSGAKGSMCMARCSIGSWRAIDGVPRLRIARLSRDGNTMSDLIIPELRQVGRARQLMRLGLSKSVVTDNMVRHSMIIHTDSLLDKTLWLESVGVDERANVFSVLGWNLRAATVRMRWLSILQCALLLTRRERRVKFSVQEKVSENSARAPVDAISPAPDTRRGFRVDEDAATSDQALAFPVMWTARNMIQVSSQDSFDKHKGIFSGPDEAVPSHLEWDSWSLSVWHFLWMLDGVELENELELRCIEFIP